MSSRKVLLLETTSLTLDLHTCHKHAGVNTTILTHSLQLLEIISKPRPMEQMGTDKMYS